MLVKGQKQIKQNYSISNRFYTRYDYLEDSHTLARWPWTCYKIQTSKGWFYL